MICGYSFYVWSVIFSMVMTGAARSVTVKSAYQSGFEAPVTVTLLYLLGQALSIIIFLFQKSKTANDEEASANQDENSDQIDDKSDAPKPKFRGSMHGLNARSEEAIQWTDRIPYFMKPLIPAFFNLFEAFLRWAALTYVAATVSEMIVGGLELTLSVIAARIFRKRLVSKERWIGVAFVTVGVVAIGYVSFRASSVEEENNDISSNRAAIGIVLIIAKCIVSVIQELMEEIFMQASNIPPTLLLGVEGLFGLIFGSILFYFFGQYLGEDFPVTIWHLLKAKPQNIGWIFGLPILFLITGLFNVLATQGTSSMTRNMWKNLRSLVVWILSLMLFYTGETSAIGEEWIMPDSIYIFLSYCVITVGIVIYYSQKSHEGEPESKDEENNLALRGTSFRSSSIMAHGGFDLGF